MHRLITPIDTRWGQVVDIMNETGWSWTELAATPYDLVMEVVEHIAQDRRWQSEKIRFDESRKR